MLLVLFLSTTVLGFGGWSEDVVDAGGDRRPGPDKDLKYCRWAQGTQVGGECSVKEIPSCAQCTYGWKVSGWNKHQCCSENDDFVYCDCPQKKNGYFSRYTASSNAIVHNNSATLALDDLIIYGFAVVGLVAIVGAVYRCVSKKNPEYENIVSSA